MAEISGGEYFLPLMSTRRVGVIAGVTL